VKINLSNIASRKKVAESNLQLSTNQLKNAMGMDINAELTIADSIAYDLDLDLQPKLTFDLQNVPDYQIQDKNITLQKFDYSRKKAGFIPTLSFYARYGAQSFSNDISTAFSQWYDYSVIGLKLNIPVFDGLRKYSVARQSKLSLLNMKENMKIISHNLELQYENASTQLLSSYNTLQLNQSNVELEYKKGAASLTDLLNSDYAYKESESNYMSSLLRYLLARLDVEKSKGTLKDNIEKL
jgi:outer membrane protein TolC